MTDAAVGVAVGVANCVGDHVADFAVVRDVVDVDAVVRDTTCGGTTPLTMNYFIFGVEPDLM